MSQGVCPVLLLPSVYAGMEVLNRAIESIMNSTDRDDWEPTVIHVTDNILSLWKGEVPLQSVRSGQRSPWPRLTPPTLLMTGRS